MRIIDEIQKYELRSKHLLRPDIALESLLVKVASMDQTIQISKFLKNAKNTESSIQKKNNKEAENKNITKKNSDSSFYKKEQEVAEIDPKINYLSPIDNWIDILDIIKAKSERVFGLINSAKLELENDILTIDLGNQGNDFIEKTLINKIQLIEDSIFQVTNKKNKINIIYDIEKDQNNSKEKHPLLDKIKDKFDGDTIK